MSIQNFEALFVRYPNISADTQRFRDQLQIAIVNTAPLLQRIRAALATITLEEHQSLQEAITAIDTVTNALAPHIPDTVEEVMTGFKQPFHAAVAAYNAAAMERRGVFRRTDQITQEEFDACRNALDGVLAGIIQWLESVTP